MMFSGVCKLADVTAPLLIVSQRRALRFKCLPEALAKVIPGCCSKVTFQDSVRVAIDPEVSCCHPGMEKQWCSATSVQGMYVPSPLDYIVFILFLK